MLFLAYLFIFSLLSVLIDLSILFSIASFVLGGILYFNSSSSLQGIAICAFGLLHLISRLCYHSKGMRASGNSYIDYNTSYNFVSISIATVIFAIPIWYIIVKSNIITLGNSPLYIFIPSLLISWAILFKIVDRIFIHNRETQEVVLGDYFTIYKSRRSLTHIYIFKFKDSPDLYSTGMWRHKIFIDKVGSKFSCTFGKGIFGTSYITSIKLIEDAGVNVPENTNSYSTSPFKKRSLTKKDYSFPGYILLFVSGILIFIFGIFILYVAHIGIQNSDVSLLKYIELYKVIGLSGIILGITLVIISIFMLIRKK
ncbi:hypothetical protein [Leptotrichia sp. oral taxon 847]|uniref:hypothetical protein n=1 Tax=Leptotrichia sp. oral taxon 847 TaxID=1785996 RepID=UPI0007684423|nr:hypothetical protein [Leptotrichia sp. oral taxon 847]AMD94619.1 hypothetical protein AXF11_02750 [Leptotrichia sp. oral taxon 847]